MKNNFQLYLKNVQGSNELASISYSSISITKSNEHKQLLADIIKDGIKLLHFESHCFNPHAQETVGEVVNQLIYDNELSRDEIYFCLKGGYFDSKNTSGDDYEVKVDSQLIHNLSFSSITKSIKESLIRFGIKTLDSFLIQDPDYFFKRDEIKNLSHDKQKVLFYEYLIELFSHLELEIKQNHLNSYGLCFDKFVFDENFSKLFDVTEFFKILHQKIPNHHFVVFECPFNIVDSSNAIKNKSQSFFSNLNDNNVFILTNRPYLTYFKDMSFTLSEFDEPEDISLIEIEDMVQAGIDLEQNLKQQLSTFEDVENEIDYLVFFEQISHYFDPEKGVLTFQNIIQKGIFPAVEQYMNLISDKPYLSKVNEQFDMYFSQFNLIIKTMSNYLMLIHNSQVSLFKSKLYECNSNYIPDLKFRSLLLSAYRNTSDITSILVSIENSSDLEFIQNEKQVTSLGSIDWQLFQEKLNDY